MEKIGSRESRPGGSGEENKDGQQPAEEQKGSPKTKLIIRGLVIIGILIIIIGTLLNVDTSGGEAPGEAPEGKVWSPEHRHWHDAE